MEMEKRSYEVRAETEQLILTGTAVVFGSPAKVGNTTEIISRAALEGADLADVALLTNHDMGGIPLARSPKTLQLSVTETGLEMRAELPDTEQGRAVYSAVKRGDLSQMSFAFDIGDSTFDESTQTRTVTKISKIYEISIVNFAAYKSTKVEARKEDNNMFNPIESAVLNTANKANIDTHATPEYRTAFYKSLLGQQLSEAETRTYSAAKTEKRADAFNTLSDTAAVVPEQTLNEIIKGLHPQGGLYNEIRMFSVPANLSVPVGTPTDSAQWHIEGAAVDRQKVTTHNVTFSAFELIKVLSMSAAAKRMTISAFESYITEELRMSIVDALGSAIVNGTGLGQPQGLLTGITWNANNSITTTSAKIIDNILKAISMLPQGYANGAKFAMSNATLFTAIYPVKTADDTFLLMPDVQNGAVRRLFGFEIVVDDNLPTGTILFGNFKFYGINIPSGVAVEMSRDSGFTSGLIDYRALCIADAKAIVPEAFIKLEVA